MPSPCVGCQRTLKCKSLDRYNSSGTCDRELSCQRQGHNLPVVVCVDCFEQEATGRYIAEGALAETKQEINEKDQLIASLREQMEQLQKELSFLRTWDNPLQDPHAEIVFYSAEGETLHAHRAILMSKSPVFKSMLLADLKDGRSGVLHLDDMPAGALRAFLNFLYFAAASDADLKQHGGHLLAAAHKFDIPPLKDLAEKYIVDNLITQENAVSFLELGSLCNSKPIKDATTKLIAINYEAFLSRSDYNMLVQRDPGVVIEFYEELVQRLRKTLKLHGLIDD
ncbi:hypothetical protein R1flu_010595 [Riccia fluitans]|uniref:BTB domain-containing protein n=1 Tax=Riccia fluitans TaxID=41844 RepID=A0ABD1Z6C1_9MARC